MFFVSVLVIMNLGGVTMKNLKAAREYCGFTQEQLAEMIDVSRVTLARYEAGNHFPDEKRLIRLADCLGVSIDYLLGRVPMDVEIKKETPPELPEGVQEIKAVVSAAADQPQLDAALEAAVRRIVRQELHRQDSES